MMVRINAGLTVLFITSAVLGSTYHKFDRPIQSVAVIGAGPAGLQVTAALLQHNFETVRLFERQENPGGVWSYSDSVPLRESYPDLPMEKAALDTDIREPGTVRYYSEGDDGFSLDERWREAVRPSVAWNSLTTNTPAQLTALPDIKWTSDSPWVNTVHALQRHVRAFASYHGLNAVDQPWSPSDKHVTSYNTRVQSLEKVDGRWNLKLKKLERVNETRLKATWWEESFDAVVVASGGYDAPHVPEIPGLKEWSEVKDEDGHFKVWHAQSYRRPEPLEGKTVLLLGASVSASGISNDIGPHVKKLYISVRPGNRTSLFKRRSFKRLYPQAEIVPEIAEFGELGSNTSIIAGSIHLANGTILTGIDEIILATGFRHSNSYLGNLVNGSIKGNDDPQVIVKPVLTEGKQGQYRNVDWRGFYIDDPTLAFATVRPWTVGRYQSLGFAKVWSGLARIPTIEQQWRDYLGHGRSYFSRSFGGVQAEAAFRKFVTWLNHESLEHGGSLVQTYPTHIREEFIYYAASAVGYWEAGVIARGNFTEADETPEKDWLADPPVEIFSERFLEEIEDY